MEESKKVILFDGVCNLCNGAVIFIIEHDEDDLFRFAALQSDIGQELARARGVDISKTDSIVFIDEHRHFVKSAAALNIARHLNKAYPLLYGFIILPRFIRDWGYDLIANNRYKWFGKRESCMVPTTERKAKFLHD